MSVGRTYKRDAKTERVSDELLWVGSHYYELPGGAWLMGLNVKSPQAERGEWMCVVKGVIDGAAVVAFVTAPELDTLVHLVMAKLMNGSLKWREDKPYGK